MEGLFLDHFFVEDLCQYGESNTATERSIRRGREDAAISAAGHPKL